MICLHEVGLEFVKATYALEADKAMMFTGDAIIERLKVFVDGYSTVFSKAIESEINRQGYSPEDARAWHNYLDTGIRMFLKYFSDRFMTKCLDTESGHAIGKTLDALNACRLWDPLFSAENVLSPDALRARLRLFPGLQQPCKDPVTGMVDNDGLELNKLVSEYTQYCNMAKNNPLDLTEEEKKHLHLRGSSILGWWQKHGHLLPTWAYWADVAAAMQPSSAGSERVFSIMNGMFDGSQLQILADYLEAGTMLRHKETCPCKEENCHYNGILR